MPHIKFIFTDNQLTRIRAIADTMFELNVGFADFVMTLIDVCELWEVKIEVELEYYDDHESHAICLMRICGYGLFENDIIKLNQ